jgi:adenylate cyclase class 2
LGAEIQHPLRHAAVRVPDLHEVQLPQRLDAGGVLDGELGEERRRVAVPSAVRRDVAAGPPSVEGRDRDVIEAELKARVREPEALRGRLQRLADEERSIYRDTYYDRPGHDLTAEGRELRVRVVETGEMRRTVLTYKEPTVDASSGSKPEHETKVAEAETLDKVFRALGLVHLVAFEKRCANYRFTARGRHMLATVVTVPEIDGTFIELETMVEEADVDEALAYIRTVLHDLGITDDDLTTEQYTDAVMRARR